MKLLVFGSTGQVARELKRACPPEWEARFLSREEADLSDPEACASAVRDVQPDVVINAAAYTAVDRAEEDEQLATLINRAAPGAIAQGCADLGIPLLHVSTDYVFDGSGETAFSPDDDMAPLGAYGRSKLAGEKAIAQAGGHWLVLRTSWVFSAHGNNFVKTMLRLGKERESLGVVDDQVGGPTSAASIAAALLTCAKSMVAGNTGGIYHFAGTPDVSWAGFAEAIMDRAGLDCRVDKITTADYPTPARRPANSRLDCSAIERDFGISRPDWRTDLDAVIMELNS